MRVKRCLWHLHGVIEQRYGRFIADHWGNARPHSPVQASKCAALMRLKICRPGDTFVAELNASSASAFQRTAFRQASHRRPTRPRRLHNMAFKKSLLLVASSAVAAPTRICRWIGYKRPDILRDYITERRRLPAGLAPAPSLAPAPGFQRSGSRRPSDWLCCSATAGHSSDVKRQRATSGDPCENHSSCRCETGYAWRCGDGAGYGLWPQLPACCLRVSCTGHPCNPGF